MTFALSPSSHYTKDMQTTQSTQPAESRKEEFEILFGPGPDYERTKAKALAGELRQSNFRALSWKLFLGVLSSSTLYKEWPSQLTSQRQRYESLLEKYASDPRADDLASDPNINNPLSQASDNVWKQYFENNELQRTINQDIVRTYPEEEFFQNPLVRQMMLRILFVYARLNPAISYKQGMHELLAPMIFLLHRNQIEHADDVVSSLNSNKYIEHDAWCMFEKLMAITGSWFVTEQRAAPTGSSIGGKVSLGTTAADDSHAPIVRKCKHIQGILLKEKDPPLHSYLEALGIEPQLYALRWLRLLMGREFPLETLLTLWDAFFSYGHDLLLVDYMAVAMLIHIRDGLIEKDYNKVMKRLFKYPQVDDISVLVQSSVRLIAAKPEPVISTVKSQMAAAFTRTNAVLKEASASLQRAPPSSQPPYATTPAATPVSTSINNLTGALKQLLTEEPAVVKREREMQAELARLRARQQHMAQRIDRIVFSINKEISNAKDPSAALDAVQLPIAELKQVRDILSGALPDETPLPPMPVAFPATAMTATNTTVPSDSGSPRHSATMDPLGVTVFTS